MAGVTIRFGILLILLGGVFFYVTGHTAYTSLIPAYFGIALILFGVLARTDNVKKRMMVMHIAVTVGLVGFLIPTIRAGKDYIRQAQGIRIPRPLAVREEILMAIICLIYVLLCVRSFVAARRARVV